jgi:hypothetical protein
VPEIIEARYISYDPENVMQNPILKTIISLSVVVFITLIPGFASAEPIGDVPELNHAGAQVLAASGKSRADIVNEVPSREMVGLPIYPGALYTGSMTADGMLPSAIMVSGDSVEKVKEWYMSQADLSYNETSDIFHAGDEYKMMKSESIMLQDISADPQASFSGMAFDMKGMKTQFTVSYKPKLEVE